MKIHALCPACNKPIVLFGDRLDRCPKCESAIPEAMRAAIQVHTRSTRPLGLTVGMFVSFTLGLMLLWRALSGGAGAFGQGWCFLAGSWLLFTAWAIWEELTWARHLALGFWALCLLESGDLGSLLGILLVLIVAISYLYSKPSVCTYYDALAGNPQVPLSPFFFRRLPPPAPPVAPPPVENAH